MHVRAYLASSAIVFATLAGIDGDTASSHVATLSRPLMFICITDTEFCFTP